MTGLTSVLAGIVLLLIADVRYDGAVGWAAYGDEAVEQAMERADRRFWVEAGDAALVGFALVIMGLLVLAALGGWLLGRRHPGPRPTVQG